MAKAETHIIVAREALLPALGLVTKAVERRNTIPILSNVLIEPGTDALTITGSDLDTEIRATVPAKCSKSTAFTVPAATLHEAVRKLPDGAEIGLAPDATALVMTAGRAKFRLQTLPSSDFPAMATGTLPHAFSMPAAQLAQMLDTTDFAISTEETRYYLNGIYLHVDEDKLCTVATDGHRLARAVAHAPERAMGMPGIIVPRRAVTLIRSLLGDKASGDVAVSLSETKIRFEDEAGRVLVSKLIDGTFPDYRRVIPQANPNAFVLDREALVRALDRVMTMAAAKGTAVRFNFCADGGPLALSTTNPDAGEANDEVAIESHYGDAIEIGINGRYALDMLAATSADTIRFRLGSAGDPVLAEPVDASGHVDADSQPLFVLMPMRI